MPNAIWLFPTGSAAPDFYGGERLGNNLYANSVVAIRASTGKVVWHFQVVHHDLWDYDVAAQPLLTTVRRNGRDVPAVVINTKMGHVFVLHRETGQPLFPIEERAVPKSDVPGEETSATQPFPYFRHRCIRIRSRWTKSAVMPMSVPLAASRSKLYATRAYSRRRV